MTFSPVPTESRNQIKKAGKILASKNLAEKKELEKARNLVDKWRACHAYPINTFQATLRTKVEKLNFQGEHIIAQRLKRMPTIINKLQRYPRMQLTTMQDIGGVRAVLESVSDVDRLASKYRDESRFDHELVNVKNYIRDPRDEDGYRSLHLIYRYKNKRAPTYNGLLVELQIRTKLQHLWATAVETMDTLLGQALKFRQGDKEWLDFFATVSSAFAHIENSPRVPRYSNLSRKETFQKVAMANEELNALNRMKGYSVAARVIAKRTKKWSHHLIILDSLERTVRIIPYRREDFEQAVTEYEQTEKRAADGEKIEPVLVSAGPIDTLRKAYPNFFLDINGFAEEIEYILKEVENK